MRTTSHSCNRPNVFQPIEKCSSFFFFCLFKTKVTVVHLIFCGRILCFSVLCAVPSHLYLYLYIFGQPQHPTLCTRILQIYSLPVSYVYKVYIYPVSFFFVVGCVLSLVSTDVSIVSHQNTLDDPYTASNPQRPLSNGIEEKNSYDDDAPVLRCTVEYSLSFTISLIAYGLVVFCYDYYARHVSPVVQMYNSQRPFIILYYYRLY